VARPSLQLDSAMVARGTSMTTYANGRRVVDIDAHILEPVGWLRSYASNEFRELIPEMGDDDHAFGTYLDEAMNDHRRRAADPELLQKARADYMTIERKGWMSFGGWDVDERRTALDQLGFECQVVFPTGSFAQIIATPDIARPEAIRAMNRGITEFCSDPRLLASSYVPLEFGPEVAIEFLQEAVRTGASCILVDSIPAASQKSFTHPDYDGFWSVVQDTGIAVFLHVGADQQYRPVPRAFFDNGRDMSHFRSDAPGDPLSFMAIGYPAELFLASLVYDGVMEKFPGLRFGVTELGASWLPSLMRFIDTGYRSFRHIQDLSHLSIKPSEYLLRQVVVSPFAGEDVGWIIDQTDPEMIAFSSDYPHHEGTDDPIRRFEASMTQVGETERQAFYYENGRRLLAL
jgi:uncharacterized protein